MRYLKKIFLIILILSFSAVFSFAQTLELKKGWNLKGTYLKISDITQFDKDGILTLWLWNNKWIVYSPVQTIKEILNNYNIPVVTEIKIGDGFWINTSKNLSLNISGDELKDNAINLVIFKGWNLKSIPLKNKTIEVNNFSIPAIYSIWKWVNVKWQVWSAKPEIKALLEKYKIQSFDTLSSGTGFWIYADKELTLPFYQIPPTPEITDEKDFYPQAVINNFQQLESYNIPICIDKNGQPINEDNCSSVCCKINATYHKVPKYFCNDIKGEIVSAEICSKKVCCDKGTTVGYEIEDNCKKILPDENCSSSICCKIGENFYNLSEEMCKKKNGVKVDNKNCANIDNICCKIENNYITTSPQKCTNLGGVQEPNSDFCIEVCCYDKNRFFKTNIGTCLEVYKGIITENDNCTSVCCYSNGEYETMKLGDCFQQTGYPVDNDLCKEVCCLKEDNSYSFEEKGTCDDKFDGTSVSKDNCEEVCCKDNDLYFTTLKANCNSLGQIVVNKDKCSQVCCALGNEVKKIKKGICDDNGGKILPNNKCEKVCCNENNKFILKSPDQCNNPVDKSFCGEVCCKIGNDYRAIIQGACTQLKGKIVDDEQCVETCCFDGTNYKYMSKGACDDKNFKVASYESCIGENKCCIMPYFKEARWIKKGEDINENCLYYNGKIVENKFCTSVCCDTGKLVEYLPYYECSINNYKVVDSSLCELEYYYDKNDNTYKFIPKGEYLKSKDIIEQGDLSQYGEDENNGLICCQMGSSKTYTEKSFCKKNGGFIINKIECEEEVCCVKNDQGNILPESKCKKQGGKIYSLDLCENVCCYTGNGYEIVKKFECGIPTIDDSKCNMVCCKQGEKYYKTTAGDCDDVNGEKLSSDKCDKVCCKIGIDYKETIKAECEKQGKISNLNFDCKETCCIVGDTSFITSFGACYDFPGSWWVNDTKNCKKMVCCLENDKAFIETFPVCENNGGTIFPIDTCNKVCCDKTKTFMKELTCMKVYGGKKVDNKVCENSKPNICCKTGDEYSIVPEEQCNDKKLSLDSCATVCCGNLAGDFYYTSKQKCKDSGRQILPDFFCQNEDNKVCCYVGGGYEYRKISECSSKIYKPDEYCDNNKLVCCVLGGETGKVTTYKECKDMKGKILEKEECESVCCQNSDNDVFKIKKFLCKGKVLEPSACEMVCCKKGKIFDFKISFDCKELFKGEVVDKDYCKKVCCENNGIYKFTSKAECSGNIVDSMKCLEQGEESDQSTKVCCYGGGDYYYWIEKDKCSVTADNSKCENYGKVCCYISSKGKKKNGTYALVDKKECPVPADDPTSCNTVCCFNDGNYYYTMKSNCGQDVLKYIVDKSYCENKSLCCEYKKNTNYASFTTYKEVKSVIECEMKNGRIVKDTYCIKTCCKIPDGENFIGTEELCQYRKGTDVDFTECGDINTSKQCTPYNAVWEMEGEWCPGEGGEPIESFLISVFYESTAFCDKNGKCYMSLDMLFPVGTTFDAFGCNMKIKDCKNK